METIGSIISTVISIVALVLQGWRLLLYFQQEEYAIARFFRWCLRNFLSVNLYFIISAVVYLLALGSGFFAASFINWMRIVVNLLLAAAIYREISRPNKKIKLVYTARLKRLIFSLILVTSVIKFTLDAQFPFTISLFSDVALGLLAAVTVAIAQLVMIPVEWGVQQYYLRQAQEKMKQLSPFTIGITGSYGKTSTKEILNQILQGYKSVLATPKSYNTLMGVTKVVNTSLQSGQEVFIVEMGAYRPGEIKDICELVKPSVGVITAIGPQHLERFKTIGNVAKAKYELIKSLPQQGISIFNADDGYTEEFVKLSSDKSITLVSIHNHPQAQLIAHEIKATDGGLEFWVEYTKNNEKALFSTALLGDHNVLNILFASAVALNMGMTLQAIATRVKTLRPVTHRLQLIKLENGVNIIDDAYNANPVGVQSALKALSLFAGKKILVTPGLVELGEMQDQENYKLGQLAGKICDLVILVGAKQTAAIARGLRDEKLDADKIKVVDSTKEGIAIVNLFAKAGDTVLYLNDLPDIYSEKL